MLLSLLVVKTLIIGIIIIIIIYAFTLLYDFINEEFLTLVYTGG